jgi:Protein of unknown function (DUF4038)
MMPAPGGGPSHGASSGAGHPLQSGPSGPAVITGLSGSTSAAHFQDQYGNPRWAWVDAVWPVVYRAGAAGGANTYQSDITTYISTRASQGYTGFECNFLPNGEYAAYTGKNAGGAYPFTGGASQDPATGLNNTYWQVADYLISTAAGHGMTIFANLLMGEDLASGVAGSWTGTQKTAYGQAVAGRYLSSPNLVWMMGDDGGVDAATASDIMTGVRNAGDTRPVAFENDTETTSFEALKTGAAEPWASSGYIGYNWVYSYNVAYLGVEYAYANDSVPVLRGDGLYYDSLGNGLDDLVMRNHLWWSVASGSRGFSGGVLDGGWGAFAPGWQGSLTITDGESGTSGDYQGAVFPAVTSYLAALPGWQKLIPDTGNTFLTAGRGTRATAYTEGQGSTPAYTGSPADSYVAGSVAPDGSLAVIYFSPGVTTTVTIDQAKMHGGYTASWVDPANCVTSGTSAGSTYTKPASANSAGDHDWVLVLR